MGYLVAFLTGMVVTLVEILSKYKRAPQYAILNYWAISFLSLNGLMSILAFYLFKDVGELSFSTSNIYVKALIIGIEWQVLLRTKILSIAASNGNKEVQVGFELLYNQLTKIFDEQIEQHEEMCLYKKIINPLKNQGIKVEYVRQKAIEYIEGRQARQKIQEKEKQGYIDLIKKDNSIEPIMFRIYEMSSVKVLKSIFRL